MPSHLKVGDRVIRSGSFKYDGSRQLPEGSIGIVTELDSDGDIGWYKVVWREGNMEWNAYKATDLEVVNFINYYEAIK